MKKSQSSLKDYMYSRAKVGAPKGNLGGENPPKQAVPFPKEEIKSRKPQIQPIDNHQTEETDPIIKDYEEKQARRFKENYEKGLMQREINDLRKREAALGGPKNVTKKIQRRAKFKKALDNTIMFLGSK
jgi:hypothetical protein